MKKTLVIGATGNIGTQVVNNLAATNQVVIVAARDLEKAKNHFNLPQIEFRHFDFTEPNTWPSAVAGVGKIFLVVPPGSASEAKQEAFFQTAKQQGVQQIVFSSGRTTGPVEGSPLNVTEGLVKNSGLQWTILRPGWFMQNFIKWIGFTIPTDNAFYLPAGESKTAFIDVRDIGAVAAQILARPAGHAGNTYDLTSLEAIDHSTVAEHISKAAGRAIFYKSLTEEDFIEKMVGNGRSQKAAEKMAWLYSFVREGHEESISEDVQNILGRPPIEFEKFVDDYAHVWR